MTADLLTVKKAADLMCLSSKTVYKLVATAEQTNFPIIRIGRTIRIIRSKLPEWYEIHFQDAIQLI